MEYSFSEIEKKWKAEWEKNGVYKVTEDSSRPKYYVLDMFPYPSGAGLHVGHPLGYVASDIYARYKRLKGYNVLHPMGYDAFGLPAEQYAIETGTHPADTTAKAIKRYREQLDKIGFSFDWSRQVVTCEADYYKWTQWIFLKLFNSWYNREHNKAESIDTLIAGFEKWGCSTEWKQYDVTLHQPFSAEEWKAFSKKERERILQRYRLAYRSFTEVNWCEALGCVLANDEVKDGKSERGGYPVTRKKMRQWSLRITEYADRLLEGLDRIDWSESLKDQQRNWIGRSEGCLLEFDLSPTLSKGEGANSQQPGYYTTDALTHKTSLANAKEMRGNPTEAEAIVWQQLRNKQTGYKFRRQHPIDKYIPDFVCLQKGLVVEIDGKIHLQQIEQDANRTSDLEQLGYTVLRFTNEEVIANIDSVVEKIKTTLLNLNDRNDLTPTQILEDEAAVKVPSFGGDLGEVQVPSFGGDLGEVKVPSLEGFREVAIPVFTTRVDTLFGATFLVIAPEHEFIQQLTTKEQQAEMEAYLAYVKSRSDVERQQEKKVTGCFTGSYAIHPFTGKQVPVWTAEYVLAGYGTGAIMAVPADDERDRKFAEKFGLPIVDIIDKSMYPGATIEDKVGKMINSGFLNGMEVKDAIEAMINKVEEMGIGQRKVNYKLRDASYSRQRYWGEPFPIKYEVQGEPDSPFVDIVPSFGGDSGEVQVPSFGGDLGEVDEADIPVALSESELPLRLPQVSSFKPTGDGRSPLANNADWVKNNYETDTMPGYAGSSWYFLRYMDPNNPNAFAGKEAIDYWQNVDVYFGGSEHAVGHLLYSRMWHKVLYDLGYVPTDEPFKKLVNQGMIQGRSAYIYRMNVSGVVMTRLGEKFVSSDIAKEWLSRELTGMELLKSYDDLLSLGIDYDTDIKKETFSVTLSAIPVDIKYVDENDMLVIDGFRNWEGRDYTDSCFLTNHADRFVVNREVEKMSKSKYNVVNPDDVIAKHGADCFRMFEMFLGPIEQSKPWDDKGISGVSNFLRKFWRLFYDDKGNWRVVGEPNAPPSEGQGEVAAMKVLHKTLKKLEDDIERLNFNTCISGFMIATNELTALGCHKRAVLEPLVIAIAPFAPFIAEELWSALRNTGSVHHANFPKVEEKYLVESSHKYAVSINGKVRAEVELPLDITAQEVEKQVLALEAVQKWTNGNPPKKFIYVKGKIVNVVV